MSSLLNKLEEYFNLLISRDYTYNQIQLLEYSIMNDVTESNNTDELNEAKEYLTPYYDFKHNSKDEKIEALKKIGTYAATGLVLGASMCLFTNMNLRGGVLLGSLAGVEIQGLKFHYHRYQINKAANELEKLIEDKINQLNPTPSFS
jgi:hypothetical protein